MKLFKRTLVLAGLLLSMALIPFQIHAGYGLPDLACDEQTAYHDLIFTKIEASLANMILQSAVSGFDFSAENLSLGERINVYRLSDNIEAIEYIHWYPILDNGIVVAIATVHEGYFGNPVVSLGLDFAYELQNFVATYNVGFALLFDEGNLYAINAFGKTNLRTSNNQLIAPVSFEATASTFDVEAFQFSYITELRSLDVPDSTMQLNPRMGMPFILRVDVVGQGHSTMDCWAAVSISLSKFLQGHDGGFTPRRLASDMFLNNGATITQTVQAITNHLRVPGRFTPVYAGVNAQIITSHLSRGVPIPAGFLPTGSNVGHMVLISGVSQLGSNLLVTYMDPAGHGSSRTVTLQSTAGYQLSIIYNGVRHFARTHISRA